jgi:hypothetical protein
MEFLLTRIGLFGLCGILPVGIVFRAFWPWLPEQGTFVLCVIAAPWLVYCLMWSKATARIMVDEGKTLHQAGYPAQQEVNERIVFFVTCIPVFGRFFGPREPVEDIDTQADTSVETEEASQ